MKYLVLLADGMADYKIDALGGKTPMEAANKPMMDKLFSAGESGLVLNVPEGMVPESDTANLAVMSYDPRLYSKGRSPLEAVSMGIDMKPDETAYRCNLVTLSEDANYDDRKMLDHSADEITTAEADLLIHALDRALGGEGRRFYTGVSYRHCLIWRDAPGMYDFARPHDIIGKRIGEYLPKGEIGDKFAPLFRESVHILENHPVNTARRARGLHPANSLWLWSPGKKPRIPAFSEKWGLKAAVISAVDLIKGIALCAGMQSINVPGATGNVHTNYKGKADAAIRAYEEGCDFVYIHVEAPDECGHRAETENKVLSIEKIDSEILAPVYKYLSEREEPFRILCLPDHPTPIALRTHTRDYVPYFIYASDRKVAGTEGPFSEENAAKSGIRIEEGSTLLSHIIDK